MITTPPDSRLTPDLDHQIGQAAIVVTAADLPQEILNNGHPVSEVNPADAEFASPARMSLRGPSSTIPERLLEPLAARSGDSA